MSTAMTGDPITISTPETQQNPQKKPITQTELEFAKCDCCGLTEECTPVYIERIRERYNGKWVCGLCAEAVKDEILRSKRLISSEEAIAKHMNFCQKFIGSGPPVDSAGNLISAMRQILRRSLETSRSTPSSPMKSDREICGRKLGGSESCFSALSR